MKKKLLFASLIVSLGLITNDAFKNSGHSFSGGSPGQNTGSLGDGQTCARSGCHGAGTGTGEVAITSNIPSGGYIPGNVYTISASASASSIQKYGFQITAEDALGTKQGSITITNTTNTKTQANSVTHTSAGTDAMGAGSKTWSYDWTAPASGTGQITFYAAFNIVGGGSAGDNNPANDIIKTTSVNYNEDTSEGTQELAKEESVSIYPNPVRNSVHITVNGDQNISFSLYNSNGQLVKSSSQGGKVDLTDLKSGFYNVIVKTESRIINSRIIKL